MRTYNFYSDPGHGWLEVERAEIERLGIADKISPFSYQKGDKVYLEEDCDLGAFWYAKKHAGEEFQLNEINEPRNDSRIRYYQSYSQAT